MAKRPSPAPAGSSKSPGFDTAHLIKVAVIIVAFICAAAYLATVNMELQNDYFLLLTPSAVTIPWLIRLGVAIILFVMLSGVLSVLVRPIWLALIACVLAVVIYAMLLGSDSATWTAAAVLGAALFFFVLYVGKQLKNQINFSAHPFSDMKLMLLSVLTVLTCVSFGLGYVKDSTRHNYIIPSQVNSALGDFVVLLVQESIDKQPLKPEQKKAAIDQIRKTAVSGLEGMEKNLGPYKSSIPALLGVTLFSILSTVLFLLGFVPLLLARLLFALLKATGFAKITTETREVKHLVI